MEATSINILNTLFWICLSFTILFFIIAVVLFFVFDIKKIFDIKTGRARAKVVKEMKAANESTGRLQVPLKPQTSKLSKNRKNTSRPPAVIPPKPEERENFYHSEKKTAESTGEQATALLQENTFSEPVFAETSVLSSPAQGHTDNLKIKNDENTIGFRVIKKSLYIHTNERI